MALFHVARYRGPEGPGAEAGAETRARALLQRLQSRARERQQRRQQPERARSSEPAGRRRRRPRRSRGRVGCGVPGAPREEDGGAAGAGAREEPGSSSAAAPPPALGPPPGGFRGTRARQVSAGGSGVAPGGRARGRSRPPQAPPFLPAWLARPGRVARSVSEQQVPLEALPEVHPELRRRLRARGVSAYFPVQAAVIPVLLRSAADGFLVGRGGFRPSDLCVSAPTGSGKTLAFVIPLVQALLSRAVCRVRALVVLPTKELAQQVSKVFNIYTDATPLRVALVTGQKSLAKEQESLVQKTVDGFRCLADIVVATPGRLVDHIDQTPGFSLQHLRFLVIDEADRMIDSMHQSWLPRVVAAAFPSGGSEDTLGLLQRRQLPFVTAASTCQPHMPLQKLLFSATLTQNPEKLQQLGLYQPRLFSTGLAHSDPKDPAEHGDSTEKYAFPAGLTHHYVPCRLRSKPLALLHLLLGQNLSRVLCFTNSRENSHRLYLLVQAFGGVTVAEFSSRYGPGQRRAILKQFEQGKIQLLISTDATARGIDVEGVQMVVNYDAPQYLRTYVHRVGRTARAGRSGQAFTLLLRVQERRFLRMLAEAGVPELQRCETPEDDMQPLVPQYEAALTQLELAIKEERAQKVV